jgi:hypothetical protein
MCGDGSGLYEWLQHNGVMLIPYSGFEQTLAGLFANCTVEVCVTWRMMLVIGGLCLTDYCQLPI